MLMTFCASIALTSPGTANCLYYRFAGVSTPFFFGFARNLQLAIFMCGAHFTIVVRCVTSWFKNANVAVVSERELFEFVSHPTLKDDDIDDYLEQLQDKVRARKDHKMTAQEEINAAVFKSTYIPRTLDEIADLADGQMKAMDANNESGVAIAIRQMAIQTPASSASQEEKMKKIKSTAATVPTATTKTASKTTSSTVITPNPTTEATSETLAKSSAASKSAATSTFSTPPLPQNTSIPKLSAKTTHISSTVTKTDPERIANSTKSIGVDDIEISESKGPTRSANQSASFAALARMSLGVASLLPKEHAGYGAEDDENDEGDESDEGDEGDEGTRL